MKSTVNTTENIRSAQILASVGLLKDKDWEARLEAIKRIAEAQDPALLEHLLAACRDSDEDVRKEAFNGVLALDKPKGISIAVELLEDDDWEVRLEAIKCIAEAQDPALLEHLLAACRDSDEDVRKEAFKGLLALQHKPKGISTAVEFLENDDWGLRLGAVRCIAEAQDPELLEHLLAACRDSDEDVRKEAFDGVLALDKPKGISTAVELLEDHRWGVRLEAVKCIAEAQDPELLEHLLAACRDSDEHVRKVAFNGVLALDKPKGISIAVELLEDDDRGLRLGAVRCIAEAQDPELLEHLLAACRDSDEHVRKVAFNGVLALDKPKGISIAVELLEDDDWEVRLEAIKRIAEAQDPELLEHLLAACRDSDEHVRKEAFNGVLALDKPKGISTAVELLEDDDWGVRLEAVKCIAEAQDPELLEHLLAACRDSDNDVRKEAFDGVLALDKPKGISTAVELLEDDDWGVRRKAVKCIAEAQDPELLEHLLAACRDSDEDVRVIAIRAIAQYDDERVVGELISSLRDVDEDVRTLAQEILEEEHGQVPALAILPSGTDGKPRWKSVAIQVDNIVYWGERLGQELLGKPVTIKQYRQGMGQTGEKNDGTVTLEVSDSALTSGHPHGEDIFRGIILHEIGHHLYDVGVRGHKTMRGIAHSEGVGDIYDILRDERLERKLRSRRPEWGVYFDRLSSYAFSQEENLFTLKAYGELTRRKPEEIPNAIKKGELPGRIVGSERVIHVSLTGKEQLLIPGLLPPLMLFLACLRCGFDPAMCPNSRVLEALRQVPRNLKNLPHSGVLEAARSIGDIIGRSPVHKQDVGALQELLSRLGEAVSGLKRILEKLAALADIPSIDSTENAVGENVDCRLSHLPDNSSISSTAVNSTNREGTRPSGQSGAFNLQPGHEFDLLSNTETLPFDPQKHLALVIPIRRHIRVLRSYLERLGTQAMEEYGSRRGRRFDMAQVKKAAFTMTPNILVHSREEINPNAYVGILIDRSGSMDGANMELAKKFGVLMAESGKGLRGIQGHVSAFDDDTFYMLGDFQRNAIASLEAGGGNNDSGALMKAADMALRSKKRNKLLIMVSDGSPAGCTFESLKNLVTRLTLEKGIVCAQVAVEEMTEIAFPHFVDLSQYSTEEAVTRFGRLLMKLTVSWR